MGVTVRSGEPMITRKQWLDYLLDNIQQGNLTMHGRTNLSRHGICSVIAMFRLSNIYEMAEVWRVWSEFSGGMQKFHSVANLWEGPYGESRKRLLSYLVERSERWLKRPDDPVSVNTLAIGRTGFRASICSAVMVELWNK